MNIIWLCIPAVLSVTSAFSFQMTGISHIRVFPAFNHSIAGVILVSSLNNLNQPEYAFNATEARRLCSLLRLKIASKAHIEKALSRGLETCRFGWIDEHFVVIPRIKPLANCGKNKIGLVSWRASVTEKFDVFCFNKSDAVIQLRDAVTDTSLSSMYGRTRSTPATQSTSSSSTLKTLNTEAEPDDFASSSQGFSGGKAVLIICTCALLLIIIIILAYLKIRCCSQRSDIKQQQEYIQTEEWTCVKTITETKKAVQEDERTEARDNSP